MTTAPDCPKGQKKRRDPWSLGTLVFIVLAVWALMVALGISGVLK